MMGGENDDALEGLRRFSQCAKGRIEVTPEGISLARHTQGASFRVIVDWDDAQSGDLYTELLAASEILQQATRHWPEEVKAAKKSGLDHFAVFWVLLAITAGVATLGSVALTALEVAACNGLCETQSLPKGSEQ